jgi:hypothetical protein
VNPPAAEAEAGYGVKSWVRPWWDRTLAPLLNGARRTQVGSWAQDGVNLGTAVRATPKRCRSSDGVEPGHTPRPRVRSKGAHAVEFSKTVAPFRKVVLLKRRVRNPNRIPERTAEYSARIMPQHKSLCWL